MIDIKKTKQTATYLWNIVANGKYDMNKINHMFTEIDEALNELERYIENEEILLRMLEIQQSYTKNKFNAKHDRKYIELQKKYKWGKEE